MVQSSETYGSMSAGGWKPNNNVVQPSAPISPQQKTYGAMTTGGWSAIPTPQSVAPKITSSGSGGSSHKTSTTSSTPITAGQASQYAPPLQVGRVNPKQVIIERVGIVNPYTVNDVAYFPISWLKEKNAYIGEFGANKGIIIPTGKGTYASAGYLFGTAVGIGSDVQVGTITETMTSTSSASEPLASFPTTSKNTLSNPLLVGNDRVSYLRNNDNTQSTNINLAMSRVYEDYNKKTFVMPKGTYKSAEGMLGNIKFSNVLFPTGKYKQYDFSTRVRAGLNELGDIAQQKQIKNPTSSVPMLSQIGLFGLTAVSTASDIVFVQPIKMILRPKEFLTGLGQGIYSIAKNPSAFALGIGEGLRTNPAVTSGTIAGIALSKDLRDLTWNTAYDQFNKIGILKKNYIPATDVFEPKVLSGEQTFPMSKSVQDTLYKFESTKGNVDVKSFSNQFVLKYPSGHSTILSNDFLITNKGEYVSNALNSFQFGVLPNYVQSSPSLNVPSYAYSATTGTFNFGNVLTVGAGANPQLQDAGLFLSAPSASYHFLGLDTGGYYSGISFNPLDIFKKPNLIQVSYADIGRYPESMIKSQGFETSNQMLSGIAGENLILVTKRSEVGLRGLSVANTASPTGFISGTSETEAILPVTSVLKVNTGGFNLWNKFRGFDQAVIVPSRTSFAGFPMTINRVVPLRTFELTSGVANVNSLGGVAGSNVINPSALSSSTNFEKYPISSDVLSLMSINAPVSSSSSLSSSLNFSYSPISSSSSISSSSYKLSELSLSKVSSSLSSSKMSSASSSRISSIASSVTSSSSRTSSYSNYSSSFVPPPPFYYSKSSKDQVEQRKKRRNSFGFSPSFSPKYVSSVGAVLFNIRGKKPARRIYSMGLDTRPLIR